MREISLLTIKAQKEYDWHVSQKFDKLGKIITVNGWGFSRRDALANFEQEKAYAEQDRDYSVLDAICVSLCAIAEQIDNIIRRIKCTTNR